jgi:3-oxoacyl-[acyl-carrier protein] reductase
MPTAIVTGASRGIGRAIALRLAPAYDIVALARSRQELDALAKEVAGAGGRCRTIAVDVSDGPAVARALDGIDADVLVNNAGIGVLKPFLELSADEWHRMVDVNLNALYHVTHAVLGGMVARGRGHIVFIGSITGRTAYAGGSCYAATKWAVMGLSESLMLEVRDRGVKVSVVSPGSVATDFGGTGDFKAKSWALRPEDVAEAVANVIDTPPHFLVHLVEVRAANPKM